MTSLGMVDWAEFGGTDGAMTVIRISSGKDFDGAEGESILNAALRSGVVFPYSCRNGRCGTCKGRLVYGSTIILQDELCLNAHESRDGWILTCARSATSAIELEIEDLSQFRMFATKTLPCRIQRLDFVSQGVLRVFLRLPPAANFEFYPGQYVDIIGHGGIRRSYSIANVPHGEMTLELHVQRVPGGTMSEYWFGKAKTGDLLRLYGPLGTFLLREVQGLDLVFLATGTGIAPVKAILEGLAQNAQTKPRSVTIYWGGRAREDLYWDVSVVGLGHEFIPVLSRGDSQWRGARGYVQHAFLSNARELQHAVVYACGSNAMIKDARETLLTAGLQACRFFSDAFVPSGSI
jgi:CDP-4-dehydro-6-deoxyglucose reductase, E3